MTNDSVPENDNISRYCSATHITEDGQITGTAFQLRPSDDYLSVNWLEFLRLNSRDEEIKEIRRVLAEKLRLGGRAKFAVLNIKEIIDSVESKSPDRRKLSVLHEPEEEDPSHSGIYGFQHDDSLISDLIAELIQETYPAKEPIKDSFRQSFRKKAFIDPVKS